MLGTEQAGLGSGYLWTPKPRTGSSSPQILWIRLGYTLGQGPILDSPHSGSGRSPLMIISVPSLYPPAHQSSSPREPQKPPSDLLLSLYPPQPQATCISHLLSTLPVPLPRPPPPILVRGGGTEAQVCGSTSSQGLGLAPALNARPRWWKCCQRQALAGSRGAYLHTIVLLVSSTLPSYRGEKVEGYQHQAGHQGPQGEEEQHPRAARGRGAGSAIRGDLQLPLLLPPLEHGTAGSPPGEPELPSSQRSQV